MTQGVLQPGQHPQGSGENADQELLPEASGMPPWLEEAFPWLGSLVLHLGLGLLFVFFWFAATKVVQKLQEPIIVPQAFTDQASETPGGIPHPGTGGDPTRDAAQNLKKIESTGFNDKDDPTEVSNLLKGSNADQALDTIGIGFGGGGHGSGGAGRGGGGALAPFGTPGGGGGSGPKSSLYGTGGNAMRIVYILDNSGSMLDNFDFLRKEAERSIDKLLPIQYFNVIMFSEDMHVLGPPTQLVRATSDQKQRLDEGIEKTVCGGENDEMLDPFVKPMEAALRMKPQLIYFLTDGKFDPQFIDKVAELNKDKKVHINTLAFVSHEPRFEAGLQKIADQNGGKYVFVEEKDLGK